MYGRNTHRGDIIMTADSDGMVTIVTERFERRLTEESSQLRVEMATEFGRFRAEMATEFGKVRTEMAAGFGMLRAEMIDRNAELLKWALVFGATQTAALAAVIALLR